MRVKTFVKMQYAIPFLTFHMWSVTNLPSLEA